MDHNHSHPVTPVGVYVAVFLTLMVLTGITVLAATIDLGVLNTPIALLIASTKATVVVWFFMEVRHARPLTRVAVVTGLVFLAIMLLLVYGDYFGRTMVPLEEGWRSDGPHTVGTTKHVPAPATPAPAHAPAKH